MTAEHPAERLSAYADDELAAAERAAVEAHLRECASCRQHVADLIAVDEAARALPVQAPPGYFDTLPGQVRARLAGRRRRSLPAWTWAAAAALLLAVVTPLTLSRRLAEPSRETAPLAPGPAARDQRPPLPETTTAPGAGYSPAANASAPPPAAPAARRRKEPSRLAEREAAASSKDEQSPAPAPPSEPTGQTKLARSAPRSDAGAAASANAGAPSEAGAPPPATAEQVVVAPSPEKRRDRPAERGALQPATKSASAAPRPAARAGAEALLFGRAESDLAALAVLPQATAAQARSAARAYDAYAQRHPGTDQADEARVRAMEALAAAWRLERTPGDRDEAQARARAYLAGEGRRRDRVRAVLAALGD